MDVQGTPDPGYSLHQGGSIPGSIRFVPGGVSRNIAHNLVLLNQSVHGSSPLAPPLLITAVGDDAAGLSLVDSCRSLGIDIEGIMTVPGGATPSVSIIFNGQGDVAASVADVRLLETALTPKALLSHSSRIQSSFLAVLDGDLSQDALEAACRIASHNRGPLTWFEPVSAPKATRATRVLSLLDFASPNIAELKAMAAAVKMHRPKKMHKQDHQGPNLNLATLSRGEQTLASLRPLMQLLLEEGLCHIVLTLGGDGAALCSFSKDKHDVIIYHAPALSATIANCSGAGDCLVSGFVYALAVGKSPQHALTYGIAAAKRAVESATNVPESLCADALSKDANKVASSMKLLRLPCGCCCDSCCGS